MTRDGIAAKLREHSVELVGLCKGLEAQHKVFSAACFAGDGIGADDARARIIAYTERQLDLIAMSMTLSRSLMHLPD